MKGFRKFRIQAAAVVIDEINSKYAIATRSS